MWACLALLSFLHATVGAVHFMLFGIKRNARSAVPLEAAMLCRAVHLCQGGRKGCSDTCSMR
jgi:hypothetical protein